MPGWKEKSWERKRSGVMSADGCLEAGVKHSWRSKEMQRDYGIEKCIEAWVSELCGAFWWHGGVELVGDEPCTVLFSKRGEDGTGTDLCILLTDLSMERRQAP